MVVSSKSLIDAYDFSKRITQNASSTFYWGSLLFPTRLRHHIWAIYAFCRYADDLVDRPNADLQVVSQKLEILKKVLICASEQQDRPDFGTVLSRVEQSEYENLYICMGDTFSKFTNLEQSPFLRLLQGVEQDLYKHTFLSRQELSEYCDRVAGTVGEMICGLCGITGVKELHNARVLGNAMQMTNILRDLAEDERMGRVYLPKILLDDYQVKLPFAKNESSKLSVMMNDIAQEIHGDYEMARKSLSVFPKRIRFALASASYMYEAILDDLEKHDFDVLNRRAYTTPTKKVWCLLRALPLLL